MRILFFCFDWNSLKLQNEFIFNILGMHILVYHARPWITTDSAKMVIKEIVKKQKVQTFYIGCKTNV